MQIYIDHNPIDVKINNALDRPRDMMNQIYATNLELNTEYKMGTRGISELHEIL